MSNVKNTKTFKEFCEEIDNNNLLDLWDYELNMQNPDEIGFKSNKDIYFKCPRNIHASRSIPLYNVTAAYQKGKMYMICKQCNSIGQYIVDHYGEDYLNKIWSNKNDKSPFDVMQGNSRGRIWLKCLNNVGHDDYDISPSNFAKTHNCPYCVGKKPSTTNSVALRYPEAIKYWSDKNNKTPYDYTYGSESYAWFKCENGKHDDYKRKIANLGLYGVHCPECGRENKVILKGENAPGWKGGVTPELNRIRKSKEYSDWRTLVFEKDNYVCQCCGKKGGRLQGHHIYDYVSYEDKRFDVMNGITLCFECHDATFPGSFHNTYGTHYKTPEELEEYINKRRKQLGIGTPFNIEEYLNGKNILLSQNDIPTQYVIKNKETNLCAVSIPLEDAELFWSKENN